jgi:ribosomal protein S18 acetylase RimI-like enzyme
LTAPFAGLSNYTTTLRDPTADSAIVRTFSFTVLSLLFQFLICFSLALRAGHRTLTLSWAVHRNAGLGHDEYASAVRIEPLPERLYDAAIRLWQDSGLTRPWNDPEADLRRAAGGGSSCVLAAIGDDDGLLATAMVGHDGHRGWVYYLAVDAAQRGRGLGRQMMEACEDWVRSRGIPKIQLMVRATNRGTIGFYEHLGYADSEVVVLAHRLDG